MHNNTGRRSDAATQDGVLGRGYVAMPGQPTLSGMLCLSNNTFGQNANICQQKLIYIYQYMKG